jgi:hypothetical protein
MDWHGKRRATCIAPHKIDARLLYGILVQRHHPRQSDKRPGLATRLRHGGHRQQRQLHHIMRQVPGKLWCRVRSNARDRKDLGRQPSRHPSTIGGASAVLNGRRTTTATTQQQLLCPTTATVLSQQQQEQLRRQRRRRLQWQWRRLPTTTNLAPRPTKRWLWVCASHALQAV